MTNYEQKHIARVSGWFLLTFWAHVPAFAAIAFFRDTSIVTAGLIGAVAASGPTLLHFVNRGSLLTALAIAVAGLALSAGLVHLGGGMIEMHFHVFVMLPLLAVFGRVSVVLAGAVTIAVHHVAFFFFLPDSLFNYSATLWIVVLHAVFVVLAAVPGCLIARMFGNYVVGATQVMSELGGAGAKLSASSDELSRCSSSAAEEANVQAAAVEEISATLQEFSSHARLSNDRLTTVKTKQLAQMRTALGEIETSGAQLNTAMTEIGRSSHAITKIVKTIEEIAFQTNILALNAAVEAARAGEVGAGFAVVAGEVRTLAGRAAQAAKETGELVTLAAQRGGEGARVNEAVSSRLATVQVAFRELDGLVGEVAQALSQQVAGVDQMTTAMQSVDQNAQSGSLRSGELSITAAALREQAGLVSGAIGELERLTGRRVGERGEASAVPAETAEEATARLSLAA